MHILFVVKLFTICNTYFVGEVVDAIEHFFWGVRNGIALELGALDGGYKTRSMTFEYEKNIAWKRVLVEADPVYRERVSELLIRSVEFNF